LVVSSVYRLNSGNYFETVRLLPNPHIFTNHEYLSDHLRLRYCQVTADGVWLGEYFYLPHKDLTTNNYHTIPISILYSSLEHISRCLVTALNNGDSSTSVLTSLLHRLPYRTKLSASLMLRPTVSRPVRLGIK
jgi:hypothetical protein